MNLYEVIRGKKKHLPGQNFISQEVCELGVKLLTPSFPDYNGSNFCAYFIGRRHYLPESKVKNYMYQLCKSIDHMHRYVTSIFFTTLLKHLYMYLYTIIQKNEI